jgi:CRISPR/Cas system type I-B associated protein Csh2 (Cas7 group RAMP superfamily)
VLRRKNNDNTRERKETPMNFPTDKRMDFVIILDVCEGSPNGDPARDNTPRTDPYDGHG